MSKSRIASALTLQLIIMADLHLEILATALTIKLKLSWTNSNHYHAIAVTSVSVLRHATAASASKSSVSNFNPNVPQSMESPLLKAANALLLHQMAFKIALAILKESTISCSPPSQSMQPLAIARPLLMELSREPATAASPMLSTCRQDRFAQLAVMLPPVFATSPMDLIWIAIAWAASSSIMSRPIFVSAPQLAHASSSLLTQLLGPLTLPTLPPMQLPPYPEATALAAQERLISSDP